MVRDYALTLRDSDRAALADAFQNHHYGMGSGHLWRRAMSRLRARLAKLGMQFLAEMLNREDISESTPPDTALTDSDTIYLAEALGFVDITGAQRLRTSFETVAHFDREEATEGMSVAGQSKCTT